MKKIVVVGSGNVGLAAAEALRNAPDMMLYGFLRREKKNVFGFLDVPVETEWGDFQERPDGAILAIPSEKVEVVEKKLLAEGIHTVDAYDIHADLGRMKKVLREVAFSSKAVAVTGAGWDPGLDSSLRILFRAAIPEGEGQTVFGPGVSLGHTAAAKAVDGVLDAVSWTFPGKTGTQKRKVYILPKKGKRHKDIEHAVLSGQYFEHDKTGVYFRKKIDRWKKDAHRVKIDRKDFTEGKKGQRISFKMCIHNPKLTGELLVAAMRASFRKEPGCYYFPELSPTELLPEAEDWEKLV